MSKKSSGFAPRYSEDEILAAIDAAGSGAGAARALGVSNKTLSNYMHRYASVAAACLALQMAAMIESYGVETFDKAVGMVMETKMVSVEVFDASRAKMVTIEVPASQAEEMRGRAVWSASGDLEESNHD